MRFVCECVCARPQPLRAKHCKDCERCVAKFDHHCIIVGTCIGERNHGRFWAFLAAQTIALAVALSIVSSAVLCFGWEWLCMWLCIGAPV